jgi:hypothetical protein
MEGLRKAQIELKKTANVVVHMQIHSLASKHSAAGGRFSLMGG